MLMVPMQHVGPILYEAIDETLVLRDQRALLVCMQKMDGESLKHLIRHTVKVVKTSERR